MTTYTNKIENRRDEILVFEEFTSREEAKISAKKLVKKFGLRKHHNHLVNYSQGIELYRNYN